MLSKKQPYAGKCLTAICHCGDMICSTWQCLWCKYSYYPLFQCTPWCHWRWSWEETHANKHHEQSELTPAHLQGLGWCRDVVSLGPDSLFHSCLWFEVPPHSLQPIGPLIWQTEDLWIKSSPLPFTWTPDIFTPIYKILDRTDLNSPYWTHHLNCQGGKTGV